MVVQRFTGEPADGQSIFTYIVLCYGLYVLSDAGKYRDQPGWRRYPVYYEAGSDLHMGDRDSAVADRFFCAEGTAGDRGDLSEYGSVF